MEEHEQAERTLQRRKSYSKRSFNVTVHGNVASSELVSSDDESGWYSQRERTLTLRLTETDTSKDAVRWHGHLGLMLRDDTDI